MHHPLVLLSKLFLVSLATIVELPSGFALETSNYSDMQISSFISEQNNETNQYQYNIEGQNIGEEYMLLSQTRMTIDSVEYAPIDNNSPFFCREVIKPNDVFNLNYEMNGSHEQSQIEMSSVAYGPIDNSMEFIRNIPQDSYPATQFSSDLYTYNFRFEFDEVGIHVEDKKTIYFLIVTFDFDETEFCVICNSSVGNETILIVYLDTTFEIDASKINVKNVEVIPYFIDNSSGLLGTIGAIIKAFVLFFNIFAYTFIPFTLVSLIIIVVVVLCCVFIRKKKKTNL
ncbi:MAG: hypothetical protein WC201_01655 [Bacilli bacterium]